ncbi:MAG: hypothetical protein ABL894_14620 [Hyphomicrobium sp.]
MPVANAHNDQLPEPEPRTLNSGDRPEPSGRSTLNELRADRISYLADMISEMQVMAHESQFHTLAGILGLANAEARLLTSRLTR